VAASRRRRLALGLVSAAGHGALILWLVAARPAEAPMAEPPAMSVALVTLPPPPEPPPKPEPAPDPKPVPEPKPKAKSSKPSKAKAAKARPAPTARPTPRPPPLIAVRPAGPAGPGASDAEMGEAELAGAATAGGGGGSGAGAGCDMAGRLQRALRKDRRVQAAVAEVHRGRALRVWNGAWVRHPGQEGAGLTAVREAILWEVGFAPEACRSEPVRGLVVVSLADGPGAARLAVGAGTWRWKDLLFSSAGRATSPRPAP